MKNQYVRDIGSRRELFLDDFLVDEMRNVRFEIQRPERREVVALAEVRIEKGKWCST